MLTGTVTTSSTAAEGAVGMLGSFPLGGITSPHVVLPPSYTEADPVDQASFRRMSYNGQPLFIEA